jgi:hypothetical protein
MQVNYESVHFFVKMAVEVTRAQPLWTQLDSGKSYIFIVMAVCAMILYVGPHFVSDSPRFRT